MTHGVMDVGPSLELSKHLIMALADIHRAFSADGEARLKDLQCPALHVLYFSAAKCTHRGLYLRQFQMDTFNRKGAENLRQQKKVKGLHSAQSKCHQTMMS